MISLKDVKRKTGPQPGGSVNLYLIPWADILSIPTKDPVTHKIEESIICKPGRKFSKYEFAPGKCKLTSSSTGSDGSAYFRTTITVSVPGDDAELLSIFSDMINGHFVAILDQATTAVKFAGSLAIPLLCVQVDYDAGGEQGDANGTSFQFENRGFMVEEYAGVIPVEVAPEPLVLTVDTIQNPDSGVANGSILVSAAGGTSPYEFKINDGAYQSSGLFDALEAGAYTMTLKDAANTELSEEIELLGISDIEINEYNFKAAYPALTGTNGGVQIIATNGLAPYEFSIDGGAYQAANAGNDEYVFTGLTTGEHTVSVKDSLEQISSKIIIIPTLVRTGNNRVDFADSGTFETAPNTWGLQVVYSTLEASADAFEGLQGGKTTFLNQSGSIPRVWVRNAIGSVIEAGKTYQMKIRIRYNFGDFDLAPGAKPEFALTGSGMAGNTSEFEFYNNSADLEYSQIAKNEWHEFEVVYKFGSVQPIDSFSLRIEPAKLNGEYSFTITYDQLEIFEMVPEA